MKHDAQEKELELAELSLKEDQMLKDKEKLTNVKKENKKSIEELREEIAILVEKNSN